MLLLLLISHILLSDIYYKRTILGQMGHSSTTPALTTKSPTSARSIWSQTSQLVACCSYSKPALPQECCFLACLVAEVLLGWRPLLIVSALPTHPHHLAILSSSLSMQAVSRQLHIFRI